MVVCDVHFYCCFYFIQVFQYDGSVQCWSPYFGFFFVVALLSVLLFVFPLPLFVSYICVKRPQVNYQPYCCLCESNV